MEMEKYDIDTKVRCTGCPYCGHPGAFPKDMRMWCISDEVDSHYKGMVKKCELRNELEKMKKLVDDLEVPLQSMHLSADGKMSYTMQETAKKED